MSDQITPEENEAICNALASGSILDAIKIYRQATGKGLKESKDFIDALIPQLKQQDPQRYEKISEPGAIGCGAKVLLCVSLAGLGSWMIRWPG